MNDTFKYKGRNSFWLEALDRCREKPFVEYPEHAPYPCKIYDGSGNFKYELSREQLMDREFKKIYRGFVRSGKKSSD